MSDDAGEQPPLALRPLTGGQRTGTVLVGLLATGAGAVAVFVSDNGAGTTALLALGALFLLVGSLGVVPGRLKMGDNEVTFQVLEQLRDQTAAAPSAEAALHDLAVRYDALRSALPAGPQRTVVLETVVLQARSLAGAVTAEDLQARRATFAPGTDGERIVTLGLVQGRRTGDAPAVAVVVAAATQPRSHFEQYQALRAARDVYPTADAEGRTALRGAAQAYLASPHNEPQGDRAGIARALLALD